jgi:hypothetical protein
LTISFSIHLSVCPSTICLSVLSFSLSISQSVHQSVCPSVSQSIISHCPSIHLPVCSSFRPLVLWSICLSFVLFVHQSLFVCPTVTLSVCPPSLSWSVQQSLCSSVQPSLCHLAYMLVHLSVCQIIWLYGVRSLVLVQLISLWNHLSQLTFLFGD